MIDSNLQAQPGALGKGQETATMLNSLFTALSYFTPILAAIISDQVY